MTMNSRFIFTDVLDKNAVYTVETGKSDPGVTRSFFSLQIESNQRRSCAVICFGMRLSHHLSGYVCKNVILCRL